MRGRFTSLTLSAQAYLCPFRYPRLYSCPSEESNSGENEYENNSLVFGAVALKASCGNIVFSCRLSVRVLTVGESIIDTKCLVTASASLRFTVSVWPELDNLSFRKAGAFTEVGGCYCEVSRVLENRYRSTDLLPDTK